jgi:hypothetical protein
MNNINLEKALRAKLMINDEKYPKELVYGKNDKYNE